MPAGVRLTGRLDTGAFAAALAEVVRRHDVLRSRFAPGAAGEERVQEPLPVLDQGAPEAGSDSLPAAVPGLAPADPSSSPVAGSGGPPAPGRDSASKARSEGRLPLAAPAPLEAIDLGGLA